MANEKTHWQMIIKDKLKELVKCTGLSNMLVVTLLQKEMIDDDQKDYLNNDKFPKSERVTKLYTEYAATCEDKDFPNFKVALEEGKNGKALSYFQNATWNAVATTPSPPPPNTNNPNVYKDGKRFMVIINVPTGRPGAEKDEIALEETFRRCNFQVDRCHDWSRDGIRGCLEGFQRKVKQATKEGDVGAVIIAVGSHGDTYDYFQTSDGQSMDIYSDVVDLFNGKNSRELEEGPKVFLVNVCRGDKVDAPRLQLDGSNFNKSITSTQERSRSFEAWKLSNNPSRTESDSVSFPKLPTWANLLIAFASYEGHVAYRHPVDGTWFFQVFCDTVKTETKDGPKCIETILSQVANVISARTTEDGEKQMPERKNIGFSKTLLLNFR